MKKEYSVVITIAGEELCKLIDREARRKGVLKDVKGEASLFDTNQEVSIEYDWEEQRDPVIDKNSGAYGDN